MKLFDLNQSEKKEFRRLLRWHLSYLLGIAGFFGVIYFCGFFKSTPYLRERFIFTYLAPLSTALFVLLSPWRGHWLAAIRDTYARLEGEPAFCFMAGLVFLFGFFLYSVVLWALGSLGPSLFYM